MSSVNMFICHAGGCMGDECPVASVPADYSTVQRNLAYESLC